MVTGIATLEEFETIVIGYDDNAADVLETLEGLGAILEDFAGYGLEGISQRDGSLLRLIHDYGFLTEKQLQAVIDEFKPGKKDLRDILVDKWISADTYQTLSMFVTGKKDAE